MGGKSLGFMHWFRRLSRLTNEFYETINVLGVHKHISYRKTAMKIILPKPLLLKSEKNV